MSIACRDAEFRNPLREAYPKKLTNGDHGGKPTSR